MNILIQVDDGVFYCPSTGVWTWVFETEIRTTAPGVDELRTYVSKDNAERTGVALVSMCKRRRGAK